MITNHSANDLAKIGQRYRASYLVQQADHLIDSQAVPHPTSL
jgi:hypothetical protein